MKKTGVKSLLHKNTPSRFKPILDPGSLAKLKTASSVFLAIIASAGILTLSAAAPNLISVLAKLSFKKRPAASNGSLDRKAAETLYYLKRSGKINIKPAHGNFLISLTKIGKKTAAELSLKTLRISKLKKWDKKWWLVAADIPTKNYRHSADLLRNKLKDMDFYPLQKTLWLYPHNPVRELQYLLSQFNIQNYVTVMEVSRLDKEDKASVCKHFRNLGII